MTGRDGIQLNDAQGYPMFNKDGIIIKTEHTIPLKIFSTFQVQSSIKLANGIWNMTTKYVYDLESEMPKGHWFAWLYGQRPSPPPTPPPDP
jgi:hypothetical protein